MLFSQMRLSVFITNTNFSLQQLILILNVATKLLIVLQ